MAQHSHSHVIDEDMETEIALRLRKADQRFTPARRELVAALVAALVPPVRLPVASVSAPVATVLAPAPTVRLPVPTVLDPVATVVAGAVTAETALLWPPSV